MVGGKVSGAGGGFMFLLAKKGKEGELRDFIQRRIAGTDAKIYNWDFDDEGITMKKQAASSDIENALRLMNDIIPAQLEKGKVYEVRYDKAKLRENAQVSTGEESPAETLLNE